MIQVQPLFDDGDQHVSGDRSPCLCLYCVFGRSKERLDTQMLFDPFEEQLDLPALFVKCADGHKGTPKVQEKFVTPIKAMIEENPSFGYRTVAHHLCRNSLGLYS